jgi:ribosomal protein S4E
MLRNRLKYALTYREVVAIVMQRLIAIDGTLTSATLQVSWVGAFDLQVLHIVCYIDTFSRFLFGVCLSRQGQPRI